jgi:hypothetical protein
MYTLIATASPNSVDPQTWLADVLRRIADHPARRLHELLPWNWQKPAIAYTGRRRRIPRCSSCRRSCRLHAVSLRVYQKVPPPEEPSASSVSPTNAAGCPSDVR